MKKKPVTRYLFFLLVLITFFSNHIFALDNNAKLAPGDHTAEVGGYKLYYHVAGKGPVMLAAHPFASSVAYSLTLKPLETHFTMVYYDPRGVGKSERMKNNFDHTDSLLEKEIEYMRIYLEQPKIWIFGHSDFSMYALEYTVDHPKQVAGLILTGTQLITPFDYLDSVQVATARNRWKTEEWYGRVCADNEYMMVHRTKKDSSGRDLSTARTKWWCYDSISAEKVIPIAARIREEGGLKMADGPGPVYNRDYKLMVNKRGLLYASRFGNIQCPVLILQGAKDPNNPLILATPLHLKLKNSKMIVIEKAGHYPWIEQPDESFAGIDSWLSSLTSF